FRHRRGVSASIPPVPTTSVDFLKRVSMFEDLDQRSLEAIANAAVEQRYETGQEIVRQGDTGVGALITRPGTADLVQDRAGRAGDGTGKAAARAGERGSTGSWISSTSASRATTHPTTGRRVYRRALPGPR